MYKLVTIEDTVRVPPDRFSEKLEDVVLDILKKSYGGITDKDLGMVLVITEVLDVSIGRIIMGDGASYHEVTFEALVYKPEVN
ncbi:MAG: DNA-directed RNA polymerase, partial [Hadesarchaea archaeon]|nr:DNA-directed RNA polymerase [Hadesarchaea archaeon]